MVLEDYTARLNNASDTAYYVLADMLTRLISVDSDDDDDSIKVGTLDLFSFLVFFFLGGVVKLNF